MEIGPTPAIRPVSMVRESAPIPDLPGVFEAEFRRQTDDDSRLRVRNISRGLEDETPEESSGEEDDARGLDAASRRRQISLFA